mgnify:CR=1 FL=1
MQHAEKKGETIKNLWVIRRVGGLEGKEFAARPRFPVIRRVGGLEVKAREPRLLVFVIRRVGG